MSDINYKKNYSLQCSVSIFLMLFKHLSQKFITICNYKDAIALLKMTYQFIIKSVKVICKVIAFSIAAIIFLYAIPLAVALSITFFVIMFLLDLIE